VSDSGAVSDAIVSVLASDSALMALIPGGVFLDIAQPGLTKFVLVTLFAHHDEYEFQDEAYEVFTFVIKAVELASSPDNVRAAAQRIRELLQDAPLTITGYEWMNAQRIEFVDFREVNDLNETRWQHCGGQYEFTLQPTD
jgi:hypothetical protein